MPGNPTSNASSTAVDLSRLPPPDVIEALDFETIYARRRAQFLALYSDFSAWVESDPAIKLLQVIAYQELILRQRINEAARANMLAYAMGADLDNLAAVFAVSRLTITPADEQAGTPAVMESDTDLRRRVLLAPDSYSVAGPTGAYVFHALTASGAVADASATSPAPGEVLVSVLSRDGDGTAPQELLDLVEAAVGADDVRPLTDRVTVASAAIVPFAIAAELTVYPGPDRSLILQTALARLDEYLAATRRIGLDVTLSGITAALHCGGVQKVTIASPAADVVLDGTQAWHVTAIDVTVIGTGE